MPCIYALCKAYRECLASDQRFFLLRVCRFTRVFVLEARLHRLPSRNTAYVRCSRRCGSVRPVSLLGVGEFARYRPLLAGCSPLSHFFAAFLPSALLFSFFLSFFLCSSLLFSTSPLISSPFSFFFFFFSSSTINLSYLLFSCLRVTRTHHARIYIYTHAYACARARIRTCIHRNAPISLSLYTHTHARARACSR